MIKQNNIVIDGVCMNSNLDPVTLLRKKVVPLFESELAELQAEDGICDIFGIHGKVYCWQDSYDVVYSYCDAAKIFTIGSYKNIGLNKGTWESPTNAMRFMDYKGGMLLVPVNEDIPEFWCAGNYFKKLSPSTPFKTRDVSGNAAYLALLEDHRAMMVIEISIRKELYLKNLLVGNADYLSLATETGNVIVPRKGWNELKGAFLQLDKSRKMEALTVLRLLTTGRIQQTSDRAQKFFSENMNFALILKETLPINPHARLIWLAAIGAVQ